jgi:hypothetical protein
MRIARGGLAVLLAASLLSLNTARAQEAAWVGRYDGPAHWEDSAEAVVLSPDGARVFVTGFSTQRPTLCDAHGCRFSWAYATIAYEAQSGELIWVDRYRGPARGADHANDLALAPNGEVLFVTGGSGGDGTGKDFATVAYDAATGERRWVARYNGPTSGLDSAQAVIASPHGSRVFVTGWSVDGETRSGGDDTDYATIAYDASTGAKLWVSRFAGPTGRDYAFEVGVTPDGASVFVTGWNAGHGETSNDAVTVAYDAATGSERWVARYDSAGGGSDAAYSLAVSPDGTRVFVAGNSYAPDWGRSAALVVAYDAAAGTELWVAQHERPRRSSETFEVTVAPDGSTVVAAGAWIGRVGYPCFAYDYLTLAFDAVTGMPRWSARYDGPAGCYDYAGATVAAAEEVVVTGVSKAPGSHQDVATIAYALATGEELWESRYDGPASGWDEGNALALGSDGSVFVAGVSTSPAGYRDYVTIRYATG